MSADAPDSHDAHASPFTRPDPRRRPPDPAGTRPKVDPESLRAADAQAAPRALAAGGTSIGVEPASGIAAAPASAPAPTAAPTSGRANRHSHRFQFLFGALGALAVAAIALAVALLRAPAPAAQAPWSAWKPASGDADPAQQIAAYIAPQYRLEDGKQLVHVTGGPPVLNGKPLTVGIFRSGQTPSALEGNVLYELCGGGVNCSIKAGKPSQARGLLVEREALELALYTFHYVSGVEHVIVTMPPPPPGYDQAGHKSGSGSSANANTSAGSSGSNSTAATSGLGASSAVVHHAFLLTAQDLASALEQPLSATLSPVIPRISQIASSPDASAVKALLDAHVHDYSVSETQQAGPVMLLEPPGIGG